MITDANGNALSRMAFDGFGKRLQDTFASANSTANGNSTYKGYTGHDMLDHLGLIHMGGRVYDPDAGRFLSADLFVQAPGNSQSYNRYSYVLNNPLSLVDPTGYRGRSTENTAQKSDKTVEEVVVQGQRLSSDQQKWLNLFAYSNAQMAIQLGGGYVLYSPALAARLDRLDRHARNGITGAARQAAKIRQQISNSSKKNGAGLGLGGKEEKGFTKGLKQYLADQQKFLTHLDDLSGANGPEAQALAADANKILMAGVQAVANDFQIEYNGEIVSARGVALDNFMNLVKNNPSYFAGRFAANTGTAALISLPFYKGGLLGVAATLVFGTSLQTTASLGAGIRAIENGLTNPIDVISHGAYGSP